MCANATGIFADDETHFNGAFDQYVHTVSAIPIALVKPDLMDYRMCPDYQFAALFHLGIESI